MTANRHDMMACLAVGSARTLYFRAHQMLLPCTGLASCKEAQKLCRTEFIIRNGSVIAPVGLLSPTLDVIDYAPQRYMPSSGFLKARWVDTIWIDTMHASTSQDVLCMACRACNAG